MAAEQAKDAGNPIFVFDSMRMRSHLFFRYLSTNPALYPIYHPFILAAYLGPERWPQKSRGCPTRLKQIEEDGKMGTPSMTYAASQQSLLASIASARSQGKIPLSGEHIFNVLKEPVVHGMHRDRDMAITHYGENPTHIPDEIWRTLRPIIVIRHPLPQIQSGYDGLSTLGMSVGIGDEDLGIFCSQRYYRYLFDLLSEQGRTPLVVDADDLLYETERVRTGLCTALDLDPAQMSESWEAMPEEQRPKNAVMRAFMSTIHNSTGIERPEKDNKDLGVAYPMWVEKWGEEVAGVLQGLVEENLGHYEYLKGFCV